MIDEYKHSFDFYHLQQQNFLSKLTMVILDFVCYHGYIQGQILKDNQILVEYDPKKTHVSHKSR